MTSSATPIPVAGAHLREDRHVCAFVHGAALRKHPMVIIGGILQENLFVVPPDEFVRELRAR